jgi:hypothetical protein
VYVLLVAGHIITWCEQNDHMQREFGLLENGCGARMNTVVINIKAARVATAHNQR